MPESNILDRYWVGSKEVVIQRRTGSQLLLEWSMWLGGYQFDHIPMRSGAVFVGDSEDAAMGIVRSQIANTFKTRR